MHVYFYSLAPSIYDYPLLKQMQSLKQYNGSLLDIGMAEQFLLHLMDIPDYHTLMLGHLTRLQFSANITRLQGALNAMVAACKFLLDSQQLRDMLHLVLRVGNFMNYVSCGYTAYCLIMIAIMIMALKETILDFAQSTN